MANWQPQPEGLQQLLSLLTDSLSSNTQVQQAVTHVSYYFILKYKNKNK